MSTPETAANRVVVPQPQESSMLPKANLSGIPADVQRDIQSRLDAIEREEGARIILAVESGSRAWGFASTDSDYDVRFIYVRGMLDYLALHERRDVLEFPLDGNSISPAGI